MKASRLPSLTCNQTSCNLFKYFKKIYAVHKTSSAFYSRHVVKYFQESKDFDPQRVSVFKTILLKEETSQNHSLAVSM